MVNQSPAENVEGVAETLAPGATFYPLENGKILAFTLRSATRAAVDAWADKIKALTKDLEPQQPFYIFNDFSDNNFSLTPYLRERIKELGSWKPDQIGYIAVALPRTFVNQLMAFFIPSIKRKNIENRMFMNRTQALDWLKENLPKSG